MNPRRQTAAREPLDPFGIHWDVPSRPGEPVPALAAVVVATAARADPARRGAGGLRRSGSWSVHAPSIGPQLVHREGDRKHVPVREPLVLVAGVALGLTLFASLGVVVGIYAKTWDHAGFVQNIVIVPLSFLGGVFYSVSVLPSPWREVSHANPIFYLVQAVRYGFLGSSDVPVGIALAVTATLAGLTVAWSAWLFHTGHKLKP